MLAFRMQSSRVCAGSAANLRKPSKVVAPAEPASTAVVTPRPMQTSSAGSPRGVQYS